jgi:hypothetical protein
MEHKHAAILRAIADGKEIQIRHGNSGAWTSCVASIFFYYATTASVQFRVKSERISGWINMYPSGVIGDLYETKEVADGEADFYRIACIPVEFNEGDGL